MNYLIAVSERSVESTWLMKNSFCKVRQKGHVRLIFRRLSIQGTVPR